MTYSSHLSYALLKQNKFNVSTSKLMYAIKFLLKNIKNNIDKVLIEFYNRIILKMILKGGQYTWLTARSCAAKLQRLA
nr:MAG TPA: hypothetical protein [Caudoviricetes sp.]